MDFESICLNENSKILNNFQYSISSKGNQVKLGTTKTDGIHIHSCYEIYFSINCEVGFFVNDKIYEVKDGDIIFSRPCDPHYCIYRKSDFYHHICFWFNCEESSPIYEFMTRKNFKNYYSFSDDIKKQLKKIFISFVNAIGSGDEIEKASYIMQIFEIIKKNGDKENESENNIPAPLDKMLEYIDLNIDRNLSVNGIAKNFFTSVATVSRLFYKYLYVSPKQYIDAKRFSVAKKLLAENLSVKEVARRIGFNDNAHFIAVFKKKFGITPKQYIKTL